MQKEQILKQYFGYTSFRSGQKEIIDNILNGNDVLGIMPTGAGKSICFQVPALILPGITIVISPLISLMKDQVHALISNGVPAAFINSTLSNVQTMKAIENAKNNKYKIIYVAPERLLTNEFIEFSQNANISMLTIDEAHCVSQWGQNFRPSYLKINTFLNMLPKRPLISAFTATATQEVKEDIINIIKLNNPYTCTTGFNRENLYFEVQKPIDKFKSVRKYLDDNPHKSGIIYCNTRKAVNEVYEKLLKGNYNATIYHAGLSEGERTKNQDDFLFDKKTIMVATNAFGMGIDKSNVSFVIHYNMPKNLEAYYQEAGRAGRDGTSADCILLYGGQDVITNQFLIDATSENNNLDDTTLEQVKEKDRERLKTMTYYCHSFDCLREYVLKYFGDQPPNFCGNCSNCNTNFEEIDVLEYSKMIISCIARMNQRFGLKVVIDTLRGSKGQKLLKLDLNKLSTYGTMSEVKEKRVREIINYLVLNEYIELTNTEFPIARLAKKSKELLNTQSPLMMKVAKEEEKTTKNKLNKLTKLNQDINTKLFISLKELRLKRAQQKKVPAFVIFSDASLEDMCKKLPKTREEFLEVSGVGEAKLNEFGNEFLELINNFNALDTVDVESTNLELDDIYNFIKENISLSNDEITITMLLDNIKVLLAKKSGLKISAKKVTDYLLKQNYLEVETIEGKNTRVPTIKGNEIGISTVLKVASNGESYKQNYYNLTAQKFIVDNIGEILDII